jgi:putative oxidoreductase
VNTRNDIFQNSCQVFHFSRLISQIKQLKRKNESIKILSKSGYKAGSIDRHSPAANSTCFGLWFFYKPATMKWGNISGIAEWFAGMGIPLPGLNAYLAASTEMAAVILLPLGLATRLISIPLMFTMVVAIVTVHLGNGFEAGNNGFEIPLYYFIMLTVLLFSGPGKYSIDKLLSKKNN